MNVRKSFQLAKEDATAIRRALRRDEAEVSPNVMRAILVAMADDPAIVTVEISYVEEED